MKQRFDGLHCVVTGVHVANILTGSCDVSKSAEISAFFGALERMDVLICGPANP